MEPHEPSLTSPAARSRRREKRAKVNKESIGAPSDFRHNLSVQQTSNFVDDLSGIGDTDGSASSLNRRSGSHGRLFVVKCERDNGCLFKNLLMSDMRINRLFFIFMGIKLLIY